MKFSTSTIAIGAIVVLLLIAGYFFLSSNEPEPSLADLYPELENPQPIQRDTPEPAPHPEPTPDTTAPAPDAPNPDVVAAPAELNNSGSAVQEALRHISPDMSKWLIPDEQVRKWVLTTDLAADGKLPKRYLPLDYPMEKFAVEKVDEKIVMAEENYTRYEPLIEKLNALDVNLLADYYRAWLPLLEKAYREQGKPGTFHQRFTTALDSVIAVTPRTERAALVRPKVLYQYEDEELEEATDLEKLLWRMGEDNALDLQAFARSLRYEINKNP